MLCNYKNKQNCQMVPCLNQKFYLSIMTASLISFRCVVNFVAFYYPPSFDNCHALNPCRFDCFDRDVYRPKIRFFFGSRVISVEMRLQFVSRKKTKTPSNKTPPTMYFIFGEIFKALSIHHLFARRPKLILMN